MLGWFRQTQISIDFWERYIVPEVTPGGHRRYDSEKINELIQLKCKQRKRQLAISNRKYELKTIQEGLCVTCKKCPPRPDRLSCQDCADGVNVRNKKIKSDKLAAGKCVVCGQDHAKRSACCDNCKEKQRIAKLERARQLLEQGLCGYCGKFPNVKSIWACTNCCLKKTAFRLWNTSGCWRELQDLHDRQDGSCPYLREPIIVGFDASIDHRIPRSKGGSDDISNLQWVHRSVNIMKWDLAHDEFLNLVRRINGVEHDRIE